MTVSSSTSRISFAGDGSTLTYSTTPIKFFTSADLDVLSVSSTGTVTTLALTTNYTVSGGSGAIGTIALTTATVATGDALVIVRRLDVVQSADFVNNDNSDAEVVEQAFDKLTMMTQQNATDISRSLVAADGYTGTFDFTVPASVLTNPGGSIIVNTGATGFAAGPTATAISTAATQAAAASVQATAAAAQAALASVSATSAAASSAAALAAVGTVKVTTGAASASVLGSAIVGDSALGITVNFTAATGTLATIAHTTALITGYTEDTAPDYNADYGLTYDSSAGALKKVLLARMKQSTGTSEVATTSGVTVTLTTAVPSWATEIDLILNGVSLNVSSSALIQIGSAASFETTGYIGESSSQASGGVSIITTTSGYLVLIGGASNAFTGMLTLRKVPGANTWIESHTGRIQTTNTIVGGGSKTLAGTLDRIRMVSVNGTDTFDAGGITVVWR